ncbi:alpha amylase, catalytic domain-containing protein [Besnoitia besnoiti]|uniref:1,4-alpha-glucan branching enzyme n=1 Tax=Besnoitia besnoiti TaxID=94643 RepID=A0A2A9MJY5_BESBE|nr:alpha amylase, catalytic domain-containing protein [Besnoitia besnoiti]PFH38285.1 alpha amylase, catalytic domain-containing protein [Besnoitia besnoiti]
MEGASATAAPSSSPAPGGPAAAAPCWSRRRRGRGGASRSGGGGRRQSQQGKASPPPSPASFTGQAPVAEPPLASLPVESAEPQVAALGTPPTALSPDASKSDVSPASKHKIRHRKTHRRGTASGAASRGASTAVSERPSPTASAGGVLEPSSDSGAQTGALSPLASHEAADAAASEPHGCSLKLTCGLPPASGEAPSAMLDAAAEHVSGLDIMGHHLRACAKLHGATDVAPRCCGDSADCFVDGGESEQSPLSPAPLPDSSASAVLASASPDFAEQSGAASSFRAGVSGFFASLLGGKEADGAAGPPPRPRPPANVSSPPKAGERPRQRGDAVELSCAAPGAAAPAFAEQCFLAGDKGGLDAEDVRREDAEARDAVEAERQGEPTRQAADNGGGAGGSGGRGSAPPAGSDTTRTPEDGSVGARDKITQELGEGERDALLEKHRGKLGAIVLKDGDEDLCLFRLWGPHVSQCWVQLDMPIDRGDSAPLRFELRREGADVWGTVLRHVVVGTPYEFVLRSSWNDCFQAEGDELHRRDPYARQTEFYSNVCYVTDASRFPWRALDSFKAPAWSKLVIYELHPGTFSPPAADRSVFETLVDKLDHIKSLNFNAIEFMPVQEFGGEWGYNPRLLLAVHGKYGTADQLRQLVDCCHEKGLAVIFDLVLNHGSSKLNSLWNWDGYGKDNCGGIYFEGGGDTGWGCKFSFFKREVRDMIIAAALCFIEEFGADGLRLDSVHNMPWDLLQELTHAVRSKHPSKILIAEVTPENPQICTGAGFDSCWVHATYYDAIKVTRGQDGSHHIDMLRAMIDVHKGFSKSHQCVNSVLGSHDQAGNKQGGRTDGRAGRYFVDLFGGRNNWHSRAQCRMWYSLQAVSRGLPMMFMGTETHQDAWWNVDEHHQMAWRLVEGDAFAEQMMKLVAEANRLRLAFDCLTDDDAPVRFCHVDYQNRVLGFTRGPLLVVLNCSELQWESREYEVQTEWSGRGFRQVFNSQAAEFGGWEGSWTGACGEELHASSHARLAVNLPKWSVAVYEAQ